MNAAARRRFLLAGGAFALTAAAGATLRGWAPLKTADAAAPENDLCIVAPPTPYDPASGLERLAPRDIPPQARCPVCGMYPARHPRWAAQVIYDDGAAHFFDSPLNLLIFLADASRFSPYGAARIAGRYVNDVARDTWTPADTAFVVHGSDALGPMRGGNLPAFARRDDAVAFARERGGKVLPLAAVPPQVLAALAHGPALQHRH